MKVIESFGSTAGATREGSHALLERRRAFSSQKFTVPLTYALLLVLVGGTVAAADLPTARPESVGMSSERLDMLKAGMKALADNKRVSGIVTMVAKDGKIVHFEAAGQRDLASGAPMTKDAIFRLHSMSKPITGVAMMMLFEEGKWQLNDPVSKYIPEFEDLKVAKVDQVTGAVTQVPVNHPMTMLELMSHSGGLSYGLGKTPVDAQYSEAKILDRTQPLQSLIEKLAKIPLMFQPGERYHYSISVDVQGYLVEKLSGQSLPDFLRSRLFDPLKMKDTAFYVPAEKSNRFAEFYTLDKDGKLVPVTGADRDAETREILRAASNWDYSAAPAMASGGGGLVSTISDYMRFCQMLLNGGELNGVRVLSPLTVELMRTNVLSESARAISPGIGYPGTGFGLDFAVVDDPVRAGGYYGKGTYFWAGYAGTWFWIDPVHRLIVIGMIQQLREDVIDIHALSRTLTYQAIVKSE